MLKNLLAIFLFGCVAGHAQNCTTQPSMNTMTMTAAGNMAVVGDTVANTITVKLDNNFTSATGYVSVVTNTSGFANPGNNGSFRIISGNGTKQIVLDGSAVLPNPSRTNGGTTAAGGQSGRYVSDLAVIRNSSRNYTFQWSTPGFTSDTWVSYGDDVDSNTTYDTGHIWRSADTVTGTQNHSITVDNLDPYYGGGTWAGLYTFTVWSDCFTGGIPDVSLSVHLPQGIYAPNQTGSNNGLQKIMTTTPDISAGLNIYTLAGYNDSPASAIFFPPQDGSHPGFRVAPGGLVVIPLNYINTTIPAANATSDIIGAIVDDWVPASGSTGGLLFTYGKFGSAYGRGTTSVWTGQPISVDSSGGSLRLTIPSTVPAAPPCTAAGGVQILGAEVVMLDGGTLPACAYPLKITTNKTWPSPNNCGVGATCGPPGTPATPIANVPVVVETWVMVFNPTGLVPTGTVGAWQNPYTGMPGIPCELVANIAVDKPNPVYSNAGCLNYERGPSGIGGNKFTYQGTVPGANGLPPPPTGQPYSGQQANCAFIGQRSENSYTISQQPIWFYDSGYVCHQLDVMFPPTGGGNNDEYEKHLLGIYWDQAAYARVMDPVLFADYQITSAATVNTNAMCATIFSGASIYCDTITYTVNGDVSAIQNGLAAGQRFRACVNGGVYSGTVYASYACNYFPYSSPSQSANKAAGGTLPATPTIYVIRAYTDANNLVHSTTPGAVQVTVDSTCPASGNCSVNVNSPPQVLNAAGYDVYARSGTSGPFYRQNTTGPIPIGTPFVFGTTTNPLQMTGATVQGSPGASIVSIIAADNVAHTLTTNSNYGTDVPILARNPVVAVMRQLTGIAADTGTNANTLVCNTCNFNSGSINVNGNTGVPTSAVVYCGVTDTGDAGAPLYSLAPNRGSTIASIPDANTINLTTPINCAAGVNFEIRHRVGPPGGVHIYGWANTPYDVWKRFGNYIGADSVMWLAQNTVVTGTGNPHCCTFSTDPGSRRENGLSLLSCHRAINVLNDLATLGATTALAPQPNCASASAATTYGVYYPAFEMIENMTGAGYGRGTYIGSFLNGVLGYALIDWWQDPLMNVQNDPQFPFWTKRLTDALWAYYSIRNSYASWCNFPHEWAYNMEAAILGSCAPTNSSDCVNCTVLLANNTTVPVNDYWSIMGNMLPLFAFFYQYTGNATIPQVGGMVRPPWQPCYAVSQSNQGTGVPGCGSITYGQAYQDMAAWIFVHMASTPGWTGAGAKTTGEMGIWQDRAIGWMGGNGGSAPSTLSILTSSLPAANIGAAYSATMAASGGTSPYTWTANVMPSGLTMSSAGVISGTPTAYGTTNITFTVTDSTAPTPGTATITLPLTVTATVPVSAYPAYQTGVIP